MSSGIDKKEYTLDAGGEQARLAGLSVAEYLREREAVAKALDMSEDELDKAVRVLRGGIDMRPSDLLIAIIEAAAGCYQTPTKTAFADIRVNGHRETWPVRSSEFRHWLAGQYYGLTGKAAGKDAINSGVDHAEVRGLYGGALHKVFVRVARVKGEAKAGDRYYLDLANERWQAVEIDAEGWRVVSVPPVRFRRTPGMQALSVPVGGGSIKDFERFFNIGSDQDFQLFITALVNLIRGVGPFMAVVIHGEQGSAKTTACRLGQSLVDPSAGGGSALPTKDKDLFVAAANSLTLWYDNVSRISPHTSDNLCRLVTGGSHTSRELYTDDGESILQAKVGLFLDGISEFVTRPDLADRCVVIGLEPIPDDKRFTEEELNAEFEAAHPALLGVLLDLTVHGLRRVPEVRQLVKECKLKLPRMADAGLFGVACETLFWEAGSYLRALEENHLAAVDRVLEFDWVARATVMYMEDKTVWKGTATELFDQVRQYVEEDVLRSPGWPKNAQGFSDRLGRVQWPLRKRGIAVKRSRKNKERTIWIARELRATPSLVSEGAPALSSKSASPCVTRHRPAAAPSPSESDAVTHGDASFDGSAGHSGPAHGANDANDARNADPSGCADPGAAPSDPTGARHGGGNSESPPPSGQTGPLDPTALPLDLPVHPPPGSEFGPAKAKRQPADPSATAKADGKAGKVVNGNTDLDQPWLFPSNFEQGEVG